jgi:DNA polymerase-3 subunit alpha
VFTFETQLFRGALMQMRPDKFEELVAIQALARPGPMANIPTFCARKRGEPWSSPHPALDEVLGETYGIMVYQEQVMQIAQVMAGYSLAGADLLRRAMGKKIRSEMDAQRKIFIDGAIAKGFTEAKAVEVFELMEKFADYGFNKSHAAAYALVSYQTAYLRANYPVAFLAASMSLAAANTEKLASLRQDAIRLGIEVLPPDINTSGADFTVERQENGQLAIRYALGAIKRVGFAAMAQLVAARGDNKFKDLTDFVHRIDPKVISRNVIEILAKAGAFDNIEGASGRQQVFLAAENMARLAQMQMETQTSGQIGLFGEREQIRLQKLADWLQQQRLEYEAEVIGFHLSAHPLDMYAVALKRLGVVASTAIERWAQTGARIKLAGTVTGRKERITRTGSRMMWLSLSDMVGSFEVTLFSEVLGRARDLLADGNALLITADVRMDGESLRITAQEVSSLDDAAAKAGAGLRIWLDRTESLSHIRALLDREGKGRGRVTLVPKIGLQRSLDVVLPGAFNVSPRLAQAMKMVPGVELVEDI